MSTENTERKRLALPVVRLISGLIVMFYSFGHLLNHALGLISLEAMEQFRILFSNVWRSPLLYWVVPAALLVHIAAAVWSLLIKKTLRKMTWGEISQTAIGFLIPFFLFQHIVATRYVFHEYGVNSSYTYYFHIAHTHPEMGEDGPMVMKTILSIMVLFVWYHSCLGLDKWMRLKHWYSKIWNYWYSVAVVTPVLSLAGVFAGMKEYELRTQVNFPLLNKTLDDQTAEVQAYCEATKPDSVPAGLTDSSWMEQCQADLNQSMMVITETIGLPLFLLFLVVLIVGFVLRAIYLLLDRKRQTIKIEYNDGSEVKISEGTTILEASQLNGIPHASICGGNGRCSTCRIRIIKGGEVLAPPDSEEKRILEKISAPPNVRLACQVKPKDSLRIHPILTEAFPSDGYERAPYSDGEELDVTILFSDLRGFTKMSDKRLPYDVVFILNQYFELMGEAIESRDGYLDKFIGDGIMAIFGIRSGAENGARQAIGAAIEMSRKLEVLNKRLSEEVDEPLRIGIGLHSGKAIVGAMGYGSTKPVTAIGSTVNTAARLEGESKKFASELLLSQEVLDAARLDLPEAEVQDVSVRGRADPVRVYVVKVARELKPQRRQQIAEGAK